MDGNDDQDPDLPIQVVGSPTRSTILGRVSRAIGTWEGQGKSPVP
jgi:hypothetical protein